MNKFILGSILAAISLMAIYGTSASNRVTSWVDGTAERTSSQSNFGAAGDGDSDMLVAANGEDSSIGQIGNRTPLERAGEIPQRQTVGAQSAFGTNAQTTDDTDNEVVEPRPPAQQRPPAASGPGTTAGGANQAQNQNQNRQQQPIRALW